MTHGMLIVALSLGAPSLKEVPKKEAPSIVGNWNIESVVVAGMKIPITNEALEFSKENKVTPTNAVGAAGIVYDYKIDISKPLAELDWINPGGRLGQTLKGIFKIEGDALTICMDKDLSGPRPTQFESPPGSTVILWTLKRAAKKKD